MAYEDKALFGFDIDYNPLILQFFAVMIFLIVAAIPAVVAVIFAALFVNLRRQRDVISKRTYRMHKNLILILGLQVGDIGNRKGTAL